MVHGKVIVREPKGFSPGIPFLIELLNCVVKEQAQVGHNLTSMNQGGR